MSRVWYPYTQMRGLGPTPEIVRASGAWLEARDGRRYLDATSSWWVTLHGHAHPRIAAAIGRQAGELEQVMLGGFTHPGAEELAERLVEILPGGLERVFYSDNGSTAVEVALKMAAQYWRLRGQEARRRIVAFDHAYHGDTVGAMAVSARSVFTEAFDWMLPPVERVATGVAALPALEERLAAEGGVASVILEPLLQGAGGMRMEPVEFVRGVRGLCDRYGALMIADEVLTGFGRTSSGQGSLFACGQAGVTPDIICLSKGLSGGFLPLAATCCTEQVYSAFLSDDRRRSLFHGHSFTGSPLGCAAALASLDVFATEPVMERIAGLGSRQAHWLRRLRGHAAVKEARQVGTVAAVELKEELTAGGYLSEAGPRIRRRCLERGVAVRPLGNVVYVLPPFCTTERELDTIWDAIEAGLNEIADAG